MTINKPDIDSTSTPFQPSDLINTPIPTFTISPTVTSTPTITLTPPPTSTSGSVPPTSPPPTNSSRTNYILYATLNFANKTIAVDQTIRYYNNTGVNLSEIVLSVQPNAYRNSFSLNSISQDGTKHHFV
ncbi:MAG: M1 family metallopeptidase [Anaerolineales bacterium]|nr:M1 family metallopeptidase [Anaerolineales bacterium]